MPAPKMTTMTAMRTRLATETVKIDQCRYRPGGFRLIACQQKGHDALEGAFRGSGETDEVIFG